MRRLLWIGDAGVSSGFARATHSILKALATTWEVHVLGLNYRGDPHDQPFDIWPAFTGGDAFGVNRLDEVLEEVGPAVVVLQQDPWNVQQYLERLEHVPTIGAIAVDGLNCRGTELNGLALAIFWTKFAADEARQGGYTGPLSIIPLGVDTDIYQPRERSVARARLRLAKAFEQRGLGPDVFVVGSVGRNQIRKRLDLTIEYFAEWMHSKQIQDACLWLHTAPTGDDAYDLELLARYYGIADRVYIPQVKKVHGFDEDTMAFIYASFDVIWNTAHGEGWWLPGIEAMACGTPCLVPEFAALGEKGWMGDAALRMTCSTTAANVPSGVSSIGGVVDKSSAVEALDRLYRDRGLRAELSQRGLNLVNQDQFRWSMIGGGYITALSYVMTRQQELLEQPA